MTNTVKAGELLTQLRKGRRWSKTELARRSGISNTSVTNYERGTRADGADLKPFKPHAGNVIKLAAAFGTPEGPRLLEAYGFSREAQEFEQNPPRAKVNNGTPVVSADEVQPGTRYEVVGALSANDGKYVLKDENGKLKVAIFVEA